MVALARAVQLPPPSWSSPGTRPRMAANSRSTGEECHGCGGSVWSARYNNVGAAHWNGGPNGRRSPTPCVRIM
eukprot:8074007-Lingulodinium_polyedra.AAC.1